MQSSSFEKKIGKTSKKLLFWAQFTQKEVIIGHILNEKQFFFRYNKIRSSGFGNFLSYQSIICFGWVINLFQFWVMFLDKKVSFLAKIAGYGTPSQDTHRNSGKIQKSLTGVTTLAVMLPKLILIETIGFNFHFLPNFVWPPKKKLRKFALIQNTI